MDGSFVAFFSIAAIVIVTPGQDTALTIRNTLFGGREAGVATAAGVAIGQATWTLAATVGLTALLVASEPAFLALRLAGAAYLVWLGVQSLRAALRPDDLAREPRRPGVRLGRAAGLRQGMLSNLGNPKMAVFFSSLLPQFVAPGDSAFAVMLGLGFTFVAMTLAWLTAYAFVVERAGHVLARPRVRRAFEAITGTILVALGLRLAAEPR